MDELTNWTPYAAAVLGAAAFIMRQSAFRAGSIALSLPATVAFAPATQAAARPRDDVRLM